MAPDATIGSSTHEAELERMRARLLDLSARNSLLNYGHPKAKSLRIVDEVPALVLERLLSTGGFRFKPLVPPPGSSLARKLPVDEDDDLFSLSNAERRRATKEAKAKREQSVSELAQALGVNPSFDLPAVESSGARHHSDRELQTLLLPDELEKKLRTIMAASVTAIQESGANILHLLFGFVEWKDVNEGKVRLAPLVLLPATLTRLELDWSTHTYPYSVAASGEDWNTNITLVEKCKREFNFGLPTIEPEENLEVYFGRVEAVLKKAAPEGWRVRRMLTLGLVSFGKILMWRDLGPKSWPEESPLFDNGLFREVLGADEPIQTQSGESGDLRLEEYNIDRLPPEAGPVPPIVVPADSSQHSVLVDVQRGRNLVVQGPPGTGKSQTITNIIADAIAEGKKVLFVAEKKTALDVVARRIEAAGLGPFCLPLHSHTTNKREFLDGLQARLAIGNLGDSSERLRTINELHTETREALSNHVELLHAPIGKLGDTGFSVLWRARRLGTELPEGIVSALRQITVPRATTMTPAAVARERASLTAFATAHAAYISDVPAKKQHPWEGITRDDLLFDDAQALVDLARVALESMRAVDATRVAAGNHIGGCELSTNLAQLTSSCDALLAVREPADGVSSSTIEAIYSQAGVGAVQSALAAAEKADRAWAQLSGPWSKPGGLDDAERKVFDEVLNDAAVLVGATRTCDEILQIIQSLRSLETGLGATAVAANAILSALDIDGSLTVDAQIQLMRITLAAEKIPAAGMGANRDALTQPEAESRLKELMAKGSALRAAREKIDGQFPTQMRPSATEMRSIAGALSDAPRIWPSIFSGSYRAAARGYRRMSSGRSADRQTMIGDVSRILQHTSSCEAFSRDPFLVDLVGSAKASIDAPLESVVSALEWISHAQAGLRGSGEIGRRIAAATVTRSPVQWRNAVSALREELEGPVILDDLERILIAAAAMINAEAVAVKRTEVAVLLERIAVWSSALARVDQVRAHAGVGGGISIAALQNMSGLVSKAVEAERELIPHAKTFEQLGLPGHPAGDDDQQRVQEIRGAILYLSQFGSVVAPAAAIDWLCGGRGKGKTTDTIETADRIRSSRAPLNQLRSALGAFGKAEGEFRSAGAVDFRAWYGAADTELDIAAVKNRFTRAIENEGTLARFLTRLRTKAVVEKSAFPKATELVDAGVIAPPQVASAFDFLLARTLAEQLLRSHPELSGFSGDLHETRRAQFVELDKALMEETQRRIAQIANLQPKIWGNSYGAVRDLTELGLIEHEIGKTRRFVPIREMFRRAGQAIQSLKPCFMMGPQAVAQYLPPGQFHFDLIVMDEASQMRPEDALGAIARGSQLVVVGDPMQLGPTSFFSTSNADDDEIEEAAAQLAAESSGAPDLPPGASVLERSESILLAAARRYPMRMLRWHYRSRYPQLISFSNNEFYNRDLVLFPHPGTERKGDGLNFHLVADATYGGSVNYKEAEVVVEAVRLHAREHPERTLLVATMNQPQRELIDSLLQEAEKDDDDLAEFRTSHADGPEPLDIKNLETVQGDERDVILVSVTYGPDDQGVVAQRFGPVNMVGGERRLNVLFTRAKYRLDVFCSFDPNVLRVTETSPRGLCVLRDYLRYARDGTLHGGRFTGREPDSDFEIEVARALRGNGFEVHTQIGAAGFFLDLAVVDPRKPGRYVLAIECDGATYHSAKSARDRDRLRQSVLEGLGWNVHRIWSTDWFRDPRGETAKAVAKLDGLVSPSRRKRSATS